MEKTVVPLPENVREDMLRTYTPVARKKQSNCHTQLANVSFDQILDLTSWYNYVL